jgi:hypothetical protein
VQLPSYCLHETNGFHHCVERPFLGRYTAFGLIASLPSWEKKRVFTTMSAHVSDTMVVRMA